MTLRHLSASALAVILINVVPAETADAQATTYSYRFQGDTDYLFCDGFTDTGYLSLYAYCDRGKIKLPGEPAQEGESGYVSLYYYDFETQEECYGSGPISECSIDRLSSAELGAEGFTVFCYNYLEDTAREATADVSAVLTGIGNVIRTRSSYSFDDGVYKYRSDFHGRFRQAEVDASIVLDGMSIDTSGLFCYGELGDVKNGYRELIRP
ncbi:hypothetical protein [Tautonia plasticadhaerens]|uniref:Uncharacterized protein n=1 Tax=Tautonia plasticadhaerens TaxID=2527974 RepID=A0A518GV98_9BACT|nr:hypothetical protein [Tautonia plasticadhaerens]QDV32501.1 hypothetical protein ElP_03340 [Tautonia plasticadhaerens]